MISDSLHQPVLSVRGLTKRYGPVTALDCVTMNFRPGEVHALIGENGAGKSTFMKILSGIETPTVGQVLLDDESLILQCPLDAQKAGITMIHQELNLIDELTVAENIYLGRESCAGPFVRRAEMRDSATQHLAAIGADLSPDAKVQTLSIAQQQIVEIAKAVAQDARIIIMDEPTAVLTTREVSLLLSLIGRLRSEGRTILYISHHLVEVQAIADRISVLRDGALVTTLNNLGSLSLRERAGSKEVESNANPLSEHDLANLMVGREVTQQFPPRGEPSDTVALRVKGLTIPGKVAAASFEVRAGEVFGFAGLIGAGRTELAEAVAGLRKCAGGGVTCAGRIAYLSEDRRGRGLVMGMSITANTTLAALRKFGRVWLDRRAECQTTQRRATELGTRLGSVHDKIDTLSGGNQQKVAIAKWLETEPAVLILDEPTRGIDIGAKAEIYRLIHDLAARGMACIVISSELNEVLGLCHRIAVMRSGQIVATLNSDQTTEETIMQHAAGVAAA